LPLWMMTKKMPPSNFIEAEYLVKYNSLINTQYYARASPLLGGYLFWVNTKTNKIFPTINEAYEDYVLNHESNN